MGLDLQPLVCEPCTFFLDYAEFLSDFKFLRSLLFWTFFLKLTVFIFNLTPVGIMFCQIFWQGMTEYIYVCQHLLQGWGGHTINDFNGHFFSWSHIIAKKKLIIIISLSVFACRSPLCKVSCIHFHIFCGICFTHKNAARFINKWHCDV